MYLFKIPEAETAIRKYLRKHPNSTAAINALNGDCAAMMELYEKLCGPREFDGGLSDDAVSIIYEAFNRNFPPAMIRLAQVEMCDDIKYWPEGIMKLMEAYKLGSQEAMTQLQESWHNCVKDIDRQYKTGDRINKYEEFILAFYYHYGIGFPKDASLAQRLFQLSARHGCDEANGFLHDPIPIEKERKEPEKPCGNFDCVQYIEQCGGNPEAPSDIICFGCGGEGPMRRYFDLLSDNENDDLSEHV